MNNGDADTFDCCGCLMCALVLFWGLVAVGVLLVIR